MSRHGYAAALGAGVFLLQLGLVARPQLDALTGKSADLVVKALTDGGAWTLAPAIAYYLLIGALAHALPLLFASKLYTDIDAASSHRVSGILRQRGAFTLFLCSLLAAGVAVNSAIFPESSAFPNAAMRAAAQSAYFLPTVLLIACSVVLYWWLTAARTAARILSALLLATTATAWILPTTSSFPRADGASAPNIIVIGADSLRPDHLRTYGFPLPSLTPTIDGFLSNAKHFSNAYTPQSRTFIAYLSILTGSYPINHGARENLYPKGHLDPALSIAHLLRERGYQTMFAIDEVRFANFDGAYGFDRIISPPPGVLDFVVGGLLDTIGTNLLQLFPYSDILLPHVAGNRAASTTYLPEVHDRRLRRAILSRDKSRPLFLVSHFCGAHVPFVAPRDDVSKSLLRDSLFHDSPPGYLAALSVVDSQIDSLLHTLKREGALDNAIVVLLSDHGEGLAMEKDRWRQTNGRMMPAYYGHGMPALDPAQSRVVFGIQQFRNGEPVFEAEANNTPVSLVDVAPTILALSGISSDRAFDGVPLMGATEPPDFYLNRPVFLESGISGKSLQSIKPAADGVLAEFGHLYDLTPDQRFELNATAITSILTDKHRSVLFSNVGISSIPESTEQEERCWLRLDLETRTFECFGADTQHPDVVRGIELICNQYASDHVFYREWCESHGSLDPQPRTPKSGRLTTFASR